MDKVVVRISVVDELNRCIVGTELRVTVVQFMDSPAFRKHLESKITSTVEKLIKGE